RPRASRRLCHSFTGSQLGGVGPVAAAGQVRGCAVLCAPRRGAKFPADLQKFPCSEGISTRVFGASERNDRMAAAPQLADQLRNTGMTDAEWRARVDLAALYHVVHYFGWTDTINTHFSARVPGEPDAFLINRYGEMFDEVTASSLIKMDMSGHVI